MKFLERILNNRKLADSFLLGGKFEVEHYDRFGNLLRKFKVLNGICNGGKDALLNVKFNSGTQVATGSWVIGLIDNSGFSALAAADTMSSHSGWTEFTGISNANRPAWGQGSSSGQSVTNSSPAQFNINASGNVYGIFVTSNNTIGGTTGELWSTAGFTSVVPVSSSDILKVTYTISC